MSVSIYCLYDPRQSKRPRYIGKTQFVLNSRLHGHIWEAKRHGATYKCRWIRKLLKQRIKPKIRLIELVKEEAWKEKECFWINFYKPDLINGAIGGMGGDVGEEGRKKISWAMTGREITEVHRRRIGKANKGRIHTKSTRQAMSKSAKKRANTAEYKGKLSKEMKKRWTGEIFRNKVVNGIKLYWTNEENRERQSNLHKGKTLSDSHKRKIGESNKGRKHSQETKLRHSQANRDSWMNKEVRKKRIAGITAAHKRRKERIQELDIRRLI